MTIAFLILVLVPSLFMACMFWLRARPEPKLNLRPGQNSSVIAGYGKTQSDYNRGLSSADAFRAKPFSTGTFTFMPMPEPGRFRFRKGRV